jgi:oligoendopeptidase F
LIERLGKGDPVARRAFDAVRGRLGSDLSYDLLAACNVDLASAAPYEALFRRMDHLITELERSANGAPLQPTVDHPLDTKLIE